MTQARINQENFEKLREILGDRALLEELMQAMSAQECKENFEHIASMHDVRIKE